jgi:Helix-turn-helix domain
MDARDCSPVQPLKLPDIRAHDPLLTHGYHPLTELKMDQAPERLPKRQSNERRDMRGNWIGCEEAAQIVGVGRTQMWRLASKGKIPCYVFGTESRPQYKFERRAVERYAMERRAKKALRVLNGSHSTLRQLRALARQGRLSPTLAALVQAQRGERRKPAPAANTPS